MNKIVKNLRSSISGLSVLFATFALALTLGFGALVPTSNAAAATADCGKVDSGLMGYQSCQGNNTPSNLFGENGWITTIINVALFIVGIACVIMIIYAGIRYTTSRGEGKAVESAKNTILYAMIGLIISILAYAIVNFVIVNLGTSN